MFARQVRLARAVSEFLNWNKGYELLAQGPDSDQDLAKSGRSFEDTHIIVLFRAKDEKVNGELVNRINSTRKMYVSGTKWDGKPACRIAVSTWKVDVEKDLKLISGVLEKALMEG
jgi:hypothetical protein